MIDEKNFIEYELSTKERELMILEDYRYYKENVPEVVRTACYWEMERLKEEINLLKRKVDEIV